MAYKSPRFSFEINYCDEYEFLNESKISVIWKCDYSPIMAISHGDVKMEIESMPTKAEIALHEYSYSKLGYLTKVMDIHCQLDNSPKVIVEFKHTNSLYFVTLEEVPNVFNINRVLHKRNAKLIQFPRTIRHDFSKVNPRFSTI